MKTSKLALTWATMLATVVPAMVHAQAVFAAGDQKSDARAAGNDSSAIIVTARRIEERLQDVPISITVYNQQQLNNRNITSATDLATFTPSLSADNNFGQDQTTFAIRGFAQDTGTLPSVGVYFGDVVAPRGASNAQPIGDTANGGDFFDLQNVQVLKGPQGTLFGRNTTGGAVLFVPQRPTDKLEGYVMGGYGNYDMRRVQGVINIPLSDIFRVRLGVDHMQRDGYLHNVGGIGPNDFDNIDYTAARLSIVGDLTPNLENYIIASYYISNNHGAMGKLVAADANQGLFGAFSAAQIAKDADNFYNVENPLPNAHSRTRQWQIIDALTWRASDTVTVKNIASYAELTAQQASPIFGINWQVPAGGVVYPTQFEVSTSIPGGDTAAESTFTEEFRLAGNSADNRFTWQTGAYLEVVRPLGISGSQSAGFTNCLNGGDGLQCTDVFRGFLVSTVGAQLGLPYPIAAAALTAGANPAIPPIGNVNITKGQTSFHDVGLYAQGSYKLTAQLSLTGGFRYTWDHETIDTFQQVYQLQLPPDYGPTTSECFNSFATANGCNSHYYTRSQKPTWLIDLDYKPSRDLLVYAKYARGYRSATIAPAIPPGGTAANPDYTLNYIKPEKVDAYEIGLKATSTGAIRGTFNVAGFYNNFSNQQLQVGFNAIDPSKYPQTAAPVNAGKSKIYGAEVEASISPGAGLGFNFGYTYLRTRIDEVVAAPENSAYITSASFRVGDPEVLSPRHKLTGSVSYTLPLSGDIGKISFGGSVTYRSSMYTNYTDRSNPNPTIAAFSVLPPLTLVAVNVNWVNVAHLPVDLNFFVTNLTDRRYYNFAAGLGSSQLGFETATVGEPRMFGGTVKVHF